MCPKSIESPHFCSGWFVWFTVGCAGRRGSWSDTNWNLSSTFPEYSCGSECDQTWEHTKGNTDVFMWLELYILWNIFPSNFIKFIFSLAPDHKLVQCWPNLNMAFANHGWSTGGIHTTQTNRDISKLQAESYTQSGK